MYDESSDKLGALIHKASGRIPKKELSPEDRVEEALQKALDNTTPERAGCAWDKD
jgi:hypothetical protein